MPKKKFNWPIKKGKRCLYCDQLIKKISFLEFIEEDALCVTCRQALKGKFRKKKIKGLEIYYIYEYDALFKTLLLQYKEIYDEALQDVFLSPYAELLHYYFHAYKVVYVPSSQAHIEKRGFHHLKGLFQNLKLEELDIVEMIEERSQKGKGLKERAFMMSNYRLKEKIDPHTKILIVDDVLTTASSLKGVYHLFEDKCAKIKLFVLAIPTSSKKERAFKKYREVLSLHKGD